MSSAISFCKAFQGQGQRVLYRHGSRHLQKKKGDTNYAVRILPIGGYVSMEGEDEDSEDQHAFNNKPLWQRMIVVVAGATVNLIMGVIIVAIMLCQSDLIGTTQIRSFYDNATSAASGLEAGDKIVKINGKRVYSQYDITFLMMRDDDGVMDFVVKRDGKKSSSRMLSFKPAP